MDVYRACTGQHGCVQSMYRTAWMCTEHVHGSMDVYRACAGQHGCVQSMYRAAWMCTEYGWPLPAVDLPSRGKTTVDLPVYCFVGRIKLRYVNLKNSYDVT